MTTDLAAVICCTLVFGYVFIGVAAIVDILLPPARP